MHFYNTVLAGFVFVIFPMLSGAKTVMAQQGRYEGWHMGPAMMGDWGMGWFGGIFMMAFWILIVVGLVLVIRWLIQVTSKKGAGAPSGSRALDILKERYARGEIDRAQFEAMKQDLAD